ncbi:hypothetical protein KC866_02240 [Patescibacteria group bacterium]|nr:hypothetical protein [Patescibacteria group bacterium]
MKKDLRSVSEFRFHLRRFISISVFVFFAMFCFSLLFVIFNQSPQILHVTLPIWVHYLGIFISFCMMLMGLVYIVLMKKYFLETQKH